MNQLIARQAIYDNKRRLVAYELLYRNPPLHVFHKVEPQLATKLILDSLFKHQNKNIIKNTLPNISDGKPCFVNFNHQSLLQRLPLHYPARALIVEVLETCQPNSALFNALSDLKYRGYKLAFDDFLPSPLWLNFLPLADIVKIDFRSLSQAQIRHFALEIAPQYDFKLLAEKIETRSEYKLAQRLNFELFQGYKFSMPEQVTIN